MAHLNSYPLLFYILFNILSLDVELRRILQPQVLHLILDVFVGRMFIYYGRLYSYHVRERSGMFAGSLIISILRFVLLILSYLFYKTLQGLHPMVLIAFVFSAVFAVVLIGNNE